MPIKFACPSCGKVYNAKDDLAGKKTGCNCGVIIRIPKPVAVESDPLFGDEPLAGDLFGDASGSGRGGGSATGSLFDEEFPAGGAIPAATTHFQSPRLPATPYQAAAPQQAAPGRPTGSYAVAVRGAGPIRRGAPEPSSLGAAGAVLIGVGLSGAGAMLGALLWAVIAIGTGFEIGWIAWGIGVSAGFGMAIGHHLSDAIDDFIGGVIASGMAVLGVLAGKYAVFQFVVMAAVNDLGDELGQVFDGQISFGMMFGPMDVLFFFLAVASAYKLGSGGGDD